MLSIHTFQQRQAQREERRAAQAIINFEDNKAL